MTMIKRFIYGRDMGKCCYCPKNLTYEQATIDHVFPKSKGGKREIDNICIACPDCNTKKGDKETIIDIAGRTQRYVTALKQTGIDKGMLFLQ